MVFMTRPRESHSVHLLTSLVLVFYVLNGARCMESAASVRRCRTELPYTTDVRIRDDTCYQFVYKEKSWTDARDYCIQYGGRLIRIDDNAENEFIKQVLRELPWINNGIWIGLNDRSSELSWRWATTSRDREEPMTWTNWGQGHPEATFHTIRDCIRMVRGDKWRWHETPCESPTFYSYRFICEYQMPTIVAPPTPALYWGKSSTTTTTTTTTTTPAPATTAVAQTTEVIVGHIGNSDLAGGHPEDLGYHHSDSHEQLYDLQESDPFEEFKTEEKRKQPGHVLGEGQALMEFKGEDEGDKKSKHGAIAAIVCVLVFLCSVFLLIVFLVVRRRRHNQKLQTLITVAVVEESSEDEGGNKKLSEKAAIEDKLSWRAIFVATRPHVAVKTTAEPNAYCDVPRRTAAVEESSKTRSTPGELLPQPPQEGTGPVTSNYISMFGGSPYDKIRMSGEQSTNTYVPMTEDARTRSPNKDAFYTNGKPSISEDGMEKYENGRCGRGESEGESSGEDCGMGGYDMPKPSNIYAEIPGCDRHEGGGEECHIYECLDDVKLRAGSCTNVSEA